MRALGQGVLIAVVVVVAPSVVWAQPDPELFRDDIVQRLELRMNSADLERLQQNFRSNDYYPVDVVWNGQTVRNCGVRSRGNGSRNFVKPGFRVDGDRYTTDQKIFGAKSFVLDNLVQDPSGVHETVAMKFFAKMDIPAPREAFVRLYLNGRFFGLYAIVESIDKDFLARIFGKIGEDTQNDGHLYEYNFIDHWTFSYFGSDLKPYKDRFSAKTHESSTDEQLYRRIEEIVRLANDLSSDRYMEQLNPKLDLKQFIRYGAIQNFLGENDGFLGYDGMNNFYFYRKENSDQHVFIAWDEDNAFWGPEFPLTVRHDENVLFRKCMEVGELRDLYYQTLHEAARVAGTPDQEGDIGWLEKEVRRQLDLVDSPMGEDTNKPYSMDDHDRERTAMIIFSERRGGFVESNLPQ